MNNTEFKIGDNVVLGAGFSRKYAVKCTVESIHFSNSINQAIYTLHGEDGNTYAGTESDIIAA